MGADDRHASVPTVLVGVADIVTESLDDDDVPTATEIPIASATLTMPPASTEDMEAIPVAVSPVVDSV